MIPERRFLLMLLLVLVAIFCAVLTALVGVPHA